MGRKKAVEAKLTQKETEKKTKAKADSDGGGGGKSSGLQISPLLKSHSISNIRNNSSSSNSSSSRGRNVQITSAADTLLGSEEGRVRITNSSASSSSRSTEQSTTNTLTPFPQEHEDLILHTSLSTFWSACLPSLPMPKGEMVERLAQARKEHLIAALTANSRARAVEQAAEEAAAEERDDEAAVEDSIDSRGESAFHRLMALRSLLVHRGRRAGGGERLLERARQTAAADKVAPDAPEGERDEDGASAKIQATIASLAKAEAKHVDALQQLDLFFAEPPLTALTAREVLGDPDAVHAEEEEGDDGSSSNSSRQSMRRLSSSLSLPSRLRSTLSSLRGEQFLVPFAVLHAMWGSFYSSPRARQGYLELAEGLEWLVQRWFRRRFGKRVGAQRAVSDADDEEQENESSNTTTAATAKTTPSYLPRRRKLRVTTLHSSFDSALSSYSSSTAATSPPPSVLDLFHLARDLCLLFRAVPLLLRPTVEVSKEVLERFHGAEMSRLRLHRAEGRRVSAGLRGEEERARGELVEKWVDLETSEMESLVARERGAEERRKTEATTTAAPTPTAPAPATTAASAAAETRFETLLFALMRLQELQTQKQKEGRSAAATTAATAPSSSTATSTTVPVSSAPASTSSTSGNSTTTTPTTSTSTPLSQANLQAEISSLFDLHLGPAAEPKPVPHPQHHQQPQHQQHQQQQQQQQAKEEKPFVLSLCSIVNVLSAPGVTFDLLPLPKVKPKPPAGPSSSPPSAAAAAAAGGATVVPLAPSAEVHPTAGVPLPVSSAPATTAASTSASASPKRVGLTPAERAKRLAATKLLLATQRAQRAQLLLEQSSLPAPNSGAVDARVYQVDVQREVVRKIMERQDEAKQQQQEQQPRASSSSSAGGQQRHEQSQTKVKSASPSSSSSSPSATAGGSSAFADFSYATVASIVKWAVVRLEEHAALLSQSSGSAAADAELAEKDPLDELISFSVLSIDRAELVSSPPAEVLARAAASERLTQRLKLSQVLSQQKQKQAAASAGAVAQTAAQTCTPILGDELNDEKIPDDDADDDFDDDANGDNANNNDDNADDFDDYADIEDFRSSWIRLRSEEPFVYGKLNPSLHASPTLLPSSVSDALTTASNTTADSTALNNTVPAASWPPAAVQLDAATRRLYRKVIELTIAAAKEKANTYKATSSTSSTTTAAAAHLDLKRQTLFPFTLLCFDTSNPSSVSDWAVSHLTPDVINTEQMHHMLSLTNAADRVAYAQSMIDRAIALYQAQVDIRTKTSITAQLSPLELERATIVQELDTVQREEESRQRAMYEGEENVVNSSSTAQTAAERDVEERPPSGSKELLMAYFRRRLASHRPHMSEAAIVAADEEMAKLESRDNTSSASFFTIKNYLTWLTDLPFGRHTDEYGDLITMPVPGAPAVDTPRQRSQPRATLAYAQRVLDEKHFGLNDVKQRILEIMAIGQLTTGASAVSLANGKTHRKQTAGKILCLVGPPGVGKTSIVSSIAEALNRRYQRVSLGGLGDASLLRGHRRTYVGAQPGAFIQAVKRAGSSNAVICLDEIDKLAGILSRDQGGRSINGAAGGAGGSEAAAALLEILDPSMNAEYTDQYLSVPFDFSQCIFVATANSIDTIPAPLLDRMDVIEVAGYTVREKKEIAQRYVIPNLAAQIGLTLHSHAKKQPSPTSTGNVTSSSRPPPLLVDVTSDSLDSLIRWWTREPGIRSMQKLLEKCLRKVALQAARRQIGLPAAKTQTPAITTMSSSIDGIPLLTITADNLAEFVGPRTYQDCRMYPELEGTPIGVCMGLAYSSHGGSTLFIESSFADGSVETPTLNSDAADKSDLIALNSAPPSRRGSFFCTGQLGSVMKESSTIAYTTVKRVLQQVAPTHLPAFQQSVIHIHAPQGSIPKDGPSAGITLFTSLLSLAIDQPVLNGLAMSGEISLSGRLLRVGGLKEKLLAAQRANVHTLVLPADNSTDVLEIEQEAAELLEGVEVIYISSIEQLIPIAFPHLISAASMDEEVAAEVEDEQSAVTINTSETAKERGTEKRQTMNEQDKEVLRE